MSGDHGKYLPPPKDTQLLSDDPVPEGAFKGGAGEGAVEYFRERLENQLGRGENTQVMGLLKRIDQIGAFGLASEYDEEQAEEEA